MGRFFKKLRDIWSHEELRKRLGITLGFILIYRIGSFIVIPGVDSDTLQEQMSALGGGTSVSGAFTTTNSLALLDGTFRRLEAVEIHVCAGWG